MNDHMNGYDPIAYASRLKLSKVEGIMTLSDTTDILDFEDKENIKDGVNNGHLTMTQALIAWLVGNYNLDVIDIFQLTDGLQTVSVIHAEVLATVYEYVFGAPYKGDVEGMV